MTNMSRAILMIIAMITVFAVLQGIAQMIGGYR